MKLLNIYYNTKKNAITVIIEPDGTVHKADLTNATNHIDLAFMKNYIGQKYEDYINGVLIETRMLRSVGHTLTGTWWYMSGGPEGKVIDDI